MCADKRNLWQRFRAAWPGFWETSSYICVTFALFVAFFEYRANRAKADLDAAWNIYQEVDHAYVDYDKVCLDHPRLDCYMLPSKSEPTPPLNLEEQRQQKILYDMLTDVFETAYVHFVKFRTRINSEEGKELFDDQWGTWDTTINSFIIRPAYLTVWFDVHEMYDYGLQCHMKTLILKTVEPTAAQTLDNDLQQRLKDWLAKPKIKDCPRL